MAQAAIHVQRNDVKTATDIYLQVLRQYPDFAPAQKRLATIYADDPDDLAKAYDMAMKARKTLPDDPELARILAELNFKRKEFVYAIQLFQQSAANQSLPPKDLYYLGMAQLQTKQDAKGRETLERALAAGLQDPLAQEARQRLAELQSNWSTTFIGFTAITPVSPMAEQPCPSLGLRPEASNAEYSARSTREEISNDDLLGQGIKPGRLWVKRRSDIGRDLSKRLGLACEPGQISTDCIYKRAGDSLICFRQLKKPWAMSERWAVRGAAFGLKPWELFGPPDQGDITSETLTLSVSILTIWTREPYTNITCRARLGCRILFTNHVALQEYQPHKILYCKLF